MEALRRNVEALSKEVVRLEVARMRTDGRADATSAVVAALIRTHPDLDALLREVQALKPKGFPASDPQGSAYSGSLHGFEQMIERERKRREQAALNNG